MLILYPFHLKNFESDNPIEELRNIAYEENDKMFFLLTPTNNYNNINRVKTGFMIRGLVHYHILV